MSYPLLTNSLDDSSVSVPKDGRPLLVGRSSAADLHISSRHCSREQLRVVWTEKEGSRLEPLSRNVPVQVDGREVSQPVRLQHGAQIVFGSVTLHYLERADSGVDTIDRTPVETWLSDGSGTPADTPAEGELVIQHGGVIGRGAGSEFLLEHPQVSRRHASLEKRPDGFWIEDLGSSNGTFVEGVRLTGPRLLQAGDRVDVGPFSLEFQGDRLARTSPQGKVRLVAHALTRSLPAPPGVVPRRILDEVSLVAEPSELLVLLGPSGSGKSTLMKALAARYPAQEGQVAYNGVDLIENFESLKQGIAYVPQRELLHEELTLRQALRYTARLRLPGDTPPEEVDQRVDTALSRVDLARQADTLVASLSGGQRKRASMASETLCEPNLLFADEVTSGLDEQADWDMMRLLRRAAERGETVVCVTHNLGNVEEFAHKIAVLARGGCLAFYGSPSDALEYFGVERLGEIYAKLARREGTYWKTRFLEHDLYRHYLSGPLDAIEGGSSRRAELRQGVPTDPGEARAPQRAGLKETLRQLRILVARYLKLIARDRQVLRLAFGQSLLVGLALSLAFAGTELPSPALEMFLLGVSCFWFGCSNASKEIVKERGIYQQERDVNLSLLGYQASKCIGLGVLGILQVWLLFLVTAWRHEPSAWAGIATTLSVALAAGTSLGLLLSAGSKTTDQATTLVPIVLIPQLVLSGALVPDMNTAADWVARLFVAGYWVDQAMQSWVEGSEQSPWMAFSMLLLHALVYAVWAYALLQRDGRRAFPLRSDGVR